MSRLLDNINSDYIMAINSLKPKKAAKTIMVYVENEDDIPFWRDVLEKNAPQLNFKISFPFHNLERGKHKMLKQIQAGKYLLLCVDSDYDYLLQNSTRFSQLINNNPYIFQTYAYSIENYKCYADSLRNLCVSASLNDEELFDFTVFLKLYSNITYELFLYSFYFKKADDNSFSLLEFSNTIKIIKKVDINEQGKSAIEALITSVNNQVTALKRMNPELDIDLIAKDLKKLGINKDNTYLFIKGHIIYDNVVLMFLKPLYNLLKNKKLQEFKTSASDNSIQTNKINQYKKDITSIEYVLRLNTNYNSCFLMRKIEDDINFYLTL